MADAATKKILRDRVVAILRSPTTKSIDFRLRGWHINSASFEKVANGIRVGDVEVDSGNVTGLAQAQYDYGTDTIELPSTSYGTDLYGAAGIVHESVHAYIDLLSSQTIESANEAAGYLAQLLYLLYSGSRFQIPVSPGDVALKIAEKIVYRPGTVVQRLDEEDLRNAIVKHPNYARKMTLHTQATRDGWHRHNLMGPNE
jgi:hypothetical protein